MKLNKTNAFMAIITLALTANTSVAAKINNQHNTVFTEGSCLEKAEKPTGKKITLDEMLKKPTGVYILMSSQLAAEFKNSKDKVSYNVKLDNTSFPNLPEFNGSMICKQKSNDLLFNTYSKSTISVPMIFESAKGRMALINLNYSENKSTSEFPGKDDGNLYEFIKTLEADPNNSKFEYYQKNENTYQVVINIDSVFNSEQVKAQTILEYQYLGQ